MRLINADELKEHKFFDNKFIQIGGRRNGKTLEAVNRAYQQGWNDAIDAIVDNAPTVEDYTEDDINAAIKTGFQDGYEMAKAKYDMAIKAILDIKEKVWEIDIPSPTIPEYVEHHEQVKSILIVIYNWLTKLEGAENEID